MKIKITIFVLALFMGACEDIEPTFFENEFLGANSSDTYEYTEPDIYTGVPTSKRVSFFDEDFDNNSNNWEEINTSQAYLNIENGTYVFQNKSNSAAIVSINKIIDQQQNFEIETSIKITNSPDSTGNGLIWGYNNIGSYQFFCFKFSSAEKLWIGYYDYNTYTYWQDWLAFNVNPVNSYNKLTIRKIDDKYYFFINEQFIKEQSFVSFYDDKIGFKVESNTTIVVDYLKIDYITD